MDFKMYLSYLKKYFFVVLVLFYIFVFILMFIPNVSDQYIQYYIKNKVSMTPIQIKMFSSTFVFANKVYNHKSEELGFYTGWSLAENDFRWTEKPEAILLFNIDKENMANFETLRLKFCTLGQQHVIIKLNDSLLFNKSIVFEKSQNLYIKITNLINLGKNELKFILPDAKKPPNGDSRLLSIALSEFMLLQSP